MALCEECKVVHKPLGVHSQCFNRDGVLVCAMGMLESLCSGDQGQTLQTFCFSRALIAFCRASSPTGVKLAPEVFVNGTTGNLSPKEKEQS